MGQFLNGLKHGHGRWRSAIQPNNNTYNTYEGEYEYDKKNGYGVFVWASGNIYKGEYRNEEREGYGEMNWTDGSMYQGEWLRGI